MKDFFATLLHALRAANPVHTLLAGAIMGLIIVLTFFHYKWKNNNKKMKLWRALCFLPLLLCVFHYFKYCISLTPKYYHMLYICAVLTAAWSFFWYWEKVYRYGVYLLNGIAVCSFFYLAFASPRTDNFTLKSYSDSFQAMVSEMEEHYVLSDWKGIHYDDLLEKYMPMVKEAEKNGDAAAFVDIVNQYCQNFNDGHVCFVIHKEDVRDEFLERFSGNDYGFSMVTLDTGETIAVETERKTESFQEGIHDGTRILAWDGVPVEEAKKNVKNLSMEGIPVNDNEEFLKAVFLAGTGKETISVTFLTDEGEEKTVSLKRRGNYNIRYRMVTTDLFTKKYTKNFYSKMLNETCGYINISKESYSFYDHIAYLTGNHVPVKNIFRKRLEELKKQGMTKLIIDLRNNMGGYDDFGLTITSLFADREYYGFSLGRVKNDHYISTCNHYVQKDGDYADLKVVVLVNMNCMSAGDGSAYYLSKLPNVTVLGMTEPNGSNQETGGECYLSKGIVSVSFPIGLVLNEKGEPNIDTAADRISRNPVDVHIPLTFDAAMQIFSRDQDYELIYAQKFVEEMQ